jgi:hypothetical protein
MIRSFVLSATDSDFIPNRIVLADFVPLATTSFFWRPETKFGHLPTNFRSFGNPTSVVWRPNFGLSPTALIL